MNPREQHDPEQGAVSIFIAVLAVAFLMVAGLAIDGGRKLGALSEARDLADNAARAGAQAIDTDAYRATGTVLVDPDAAAQAAADYLATVGHTGTVNVAADTVTVTVQLQVNTRFLPGPWTVTATESAAPVLGAQGAP
ncbi:MAG: pilus assembly protein TadG-related protein [Actinomycetota bacterium]|nr:pilus assembly protein TadG-related protein [Actinomycetota bacterium]